MNNVELVAYLKQVHNQMLLLDDTQKLKAKILEQIREKRSQIVQKLRSGDGTDLSELQASRNMTAYRDYREGYSSFYLEQY